MGRTINSTTVNSKDFPAMVGIRKLGEYVKGKVLAVGLTKKNNPVLTLELIDLEGSSSKQIEKGKYQEVTVNAGDKVQFVGNLTDLREKLPQVTVGEIVTIKYLNDVPSGKGHPKKIFDINVESEEEYLASLKS